MAKRESLYTVGRNVNLYSHCRKQYGNFSKIKSETIIWLRNPTSGHISKRKEIIVLGRYLYFHIHGTLIAKIWKQPKCLLIDEWIKKMWHTYPTIVMSLNKEGNFSICDTMNETGGHYAKWNKSGRKTWYHLYVHQIEKIKPHRNRIIWWLPGVEGWGKWKGVARRVRTFSNKINKF